MKWTAACPAVAQAGQAFQALRALRATAQAAMSPNVNHPTPAAWEAGAAQVAEVGYQERWAWARLSGTAEMKSEARKSAARESAVVTSSARRRGGEEDAT